MLRRILPASGRFFFSAKAGGRHTFAVPGAHGYEFHQLERDFVWIALWCGGGF